MGEYKWKPIEPLSDEERAIDLAATRPLYESWHAARERLAQSSSASLKRFTDRLIRRLSIETGILEHLYDIDRGTTEALVAQGFAEDLVSHTSTNIEPGRLIDFLRDQEAAIQLVIDCLAGNRELTKGLIHELHAILTQHQDTTTAADQFGNRLEIPLLKGQYKKQPNNPKRRDGSLHEYCPPVQVESEMDSLLGLLAAYDGDDPILVAAWFHHRFTQIHPYQDGNGRVGRALATLILLKNDLLPLVIDRDLRVEYLDSLEKADQGDLSPVATLFARLERAAILEALSIDIDAEIEQERTLTSAVIRSLAAKFNKRREEKHGELRLVNDLAERLRLRTRRGIERAFNELRKPVLTLTEPEISVRDGGPDRGNAHYFKFEVVKSANKFEQANPDSSADKYVNFNEAHYFIKASMRVGRERLVFVTSFHHVGRELTGIMEATAFARMESYEDSEDRERVSQDFFPCSLDPFVFTFKTEENQISETFDRWLDSALAIAIKEFGDRL